MSKIVLRSSRVPLGNLCSSTRRSLLLGCGATLMCSRAAVAADAIDEQGYVLIGGIQQWVAIQGEDTKPAILYLHGGPGEAQSPFLNTFAPWRRDYTVIN